MLVNEVWDVPQSPAMTTVPQLPGNGSRRTQAERRAATQTRLLDAAVECLIERGYAATSVVDVQQRAGTSRGALQHYWPSRAALMVEAVRALFDSMAARLRADMETRAADIVESDPATRMEAAIELLWSSFDSALFRAELELWVAARHDAELRPLVVQHDRRLATEIAQLCRDMFGRELAEHPRYGETIELLTHGMRGAALVVDLHPKRRPQLVPEWHRQTCLALDVSNRR
jgi:AcrR family transcriptional regulator